VDLRDVLEVLISWYNRCFESAVKGKPPTFRRLATATGGRAF